MKTILASAYAVNPYHGSEDGMGWNFIWQIARFNNVIAITRKNTQSHIERYMEENPSDVYHNIKFVYYDLPYWMRFWKRGHRGALLYYYLWQFFMPYFVRKRKLKFDIVHNVNFHNDWTPSHLWKLKKPFVWGPIGHHPRIPKDYILHVYGKKQFFLEQLKWAVKKFFWKIDPFLRQTVAHADAVLAMNSSVGNVLSVGEKKIYRIPSVSSEIENYSETKRQDMFTILSAGRFVPLKGFDITIKSFSRFYTRLSKEEQQKVRLILVGDGPYKKYLVQLIHELHLESAVEIISWMERKELKKLYRQSNAFLFPSHEGAGMVVAEALSSGLPVLCFNNSGPGEFVDETCGIKISYGNYNNSITNFSEGIHQLYIDKSYCEKLSAGAVEKFKNDFDWNKKGELLKVVYENVLRNAG